MKGAIMDKFTPIYLKDEDINDIAAFLGLDFEYCRQRILNYDAMEMAEAWNKAAPKTPVDRSKFYSGTDLYIFELTKIGASRERSELHGKIIDYLLENYPMSLYPKVLDFGAGIGTDLLPFARNGYEAYYADISGKTADFLRYRFEKRKIKVNFFPIEGTQAHLKGRFDIIICFDVLEHLLNPLKTLSLLTRHLKNSGVIAIINCPDDQGGTHPCHLPQTFLPLGKQWWLTLDYVGLTELRGIKNVYRKDIFIKALLKRMRYFICKQTSLYITRVSLK